MDHTLKIMWKIFIFKWHWIKKWTRNGVNMGSRSSMMQDRKTDRREAHWKLKYNINIKQKKMSCKNNRQALFHSGFAPRKHAAYFNVIEPQFYLHWAEYLGLSYCKSTISLTIWCSSNTEWKITIQICVGSRIPPCRTIIITPCHYLQSSCSYCSSTSSCSNFSGSWGAGLKNTVLYDKTCYRRAISVGEKNFPASWHHHLDVNWT